MDEKAIEAVSKRLDAADDLVESLRYAIEHDEIDEAGAVADQLAETTGEVAKLVPDV